ncbi:FAD binding domain protein [Mycobacterium xenopi 4042]|uniref:FAD binding domain protein n=1 Tax=Mycobacterium xenopi 4042 TaxID=1299334 RepID=X7YIK6_MYCXE|nr:FAD binding domain protein [Mycobacterium xenopi 4042]
MILQTLYQNCIRHDVQFFNEFYVLDLALTDTASGPVTAGVVAYELATGDIHVFHAKAVVIATGGSGRIYKTTSNAHTLTGDGIAVVFRNGLPLEDMEFHQFHPTGLAGLGILISEAVRGEGGRLLNGEGERFMERYAPTIVDLAPATSWPARWCGRCARAAVPARARTMCTLMCATSAQTCWPPSCPTSPSSRVPIWAWTRSPSWCRCIRRVTTSWAVSRPRSPGRCCGTTPLRCRACTRPANAPACRCTARTGWAPIRCWTSTSLAAAPVSPPPTTH